MDKKTVASRKTRKKTCTVKWLLRIASLLLVSAAIFAAALWLCFPWYAQPLLDRATKGRSISITLHQPGRPGLNGIHLGRIDASFTTQPDSCTGIASTYTIALHNAGLSYQFISTISGNKQKQGTPPLRAIDLALQADSLTLLQQPARIHFKDSKPLMHARILITQHKGLLPELRPEFLDYSISGGSAETGKLRIDDLSYHVHLTGTNRWVQQPALFTASSLYSDNDKTPLSGFRATFGLEKKPDKPCILTFTDCSLNLFRWKATVPVIEYSLRKKETRFTLALEAIPLEELPWLKKRTGTHSPATLTGTVHGEIPVGYRDSTLTVHQAFVKAGAGTKLNLYTAEGKPLLTFDAASRKGAPDMIRNLNATVTLNSRDSKLTAISLTGLSSQVFGGTLTSSPVRYDLNRKRTSFTLRLANSALLDRIRLYGEFSGALNGNVSGVLPVALDRGQISIHDARLRSTGGGTIRQTPPRQEKQTADSRFTAPPGIVTYTFSEPDLVLNRDSGGRVTLGFTLKSLMRKNPGGELLLTAPKGTLTLFGNKAKPSELSLSNFSAGLFDGTIAIDHVDYDLQKKEAETILLINGMSLQKLVDLQSGRKIIATGTLQGKIPVIIKGDTFHIPKGELSAEQPGQIIYTTTPEERATANPGLKITYDALNNFLYINILSSITLEPDGRCVIAMQLKGHNPDFQEGRPVHLNLNIEQNLHDLFRSLSISSGIEESITEKAIKLKGKK